VQSLLAEVSRIDPNYVPPSNLVHRLMGMAPSYSVPGEIIGLVNDSPAGRDAGNDLVGKTGRDAGSDLVSPTGRDGGGDDDLVVQTRDVEIELDDDFGAGAGGEVPELESVETFGEFRPAPPRAGSSDWFRLFVEEQMARVTQMRKETEEIMRAGTSDIVRQRTELQNAVREHRRAVAAHRQEMEQFSVKAASIRENLLAGLRAQVSQSRDECEKFRAGWRAMTERFEEHAQAAKTAQESLTDRVNELNAGRATVQQKVEDFVQWTAAQKQELEERAQQISSALGKVEGDLLTAPV
jgi:uncharacterized coiled-coil protein SlyX